MAWSVPKSALHSMESVEYANDDHASRLVVLQLLDPLEASLCRGLVVYAHVPHAAGMCSSYLQLCELIAYARGESCMLTQGLTQI